jgi:hypothetical protein
MSRNAVKTIKNEKINDTQRVYSELSAISKAAGPATLTTRRCHAHACIPARPKKSHEETVENDEGRGQKLGTGASKTIDSHKRERERDLHARERLVGKTLPSAA